MKVGIILAGGKGTRFGATETNKTAELYLGKPMVCYGVDLLKDFCDKIVVVTGFAKESVENALKDYDNIIFAEQENPNGTGHALEVAIDKLHELKIRPSEIFLGYGDHMMFYDQATVNGIVAAHERDKSIVTLITTRHNDPNTLAWGRIVRNEAGKFERIVEQKAATEEEKNITELNASLYYINYNFAEKEVGNIKETPPANERYVTDLIGIATSKNLNVTAFEVPFEKVGLGINSRVEVSQSEELYQKSVFATL